MPPLSVIIREDRLRSMYLQSTNAEVEMSSGLVIEPLSTGCTPITYYAANNSEVKHECDLKWLVTLRGERGGRRPVSGDLSTSMNYDWAVIQNKVLIHSLLQQDRHPSIMSNRHTVYYHAKGERGLWHELNSLCFWYTWSLQGHLWTTSAYSGWFISLF